MALTKEEVKKAFREVMAKDYADVPPKEEIEYTPSPRAKAKMEAFLKEEAEGIQKRRPRHKT